MRDHAIERTLNAVFPATLMALVLCAFHLLGPSMINADRFAWQSTMLAKTTAVREIVELHETFGPFAQRPLATWCIRCLAAITGNLWLGYIVFIALSFWVAALALQQAARVWGARRVGAATACFALSFTILFAYFAPLYSYDDLLQYAFVFLALLSLDGYPVRAALWLCLGVMARETSLLILPGMAIASLGFAPAVPSPSDHRLTSKRTVRAAAVVAIPAFFYAVTKYLLPFPDMAGRMHHWAANFATAKSTVEALVFLVEALGLVAIVGWQSQRLQPRGARRANLLVIAFLVTLLINTPIVFVASRAREARLFALPLVFLWPIAGEWLALCAQALQRTWRARADALRRLVVYPMLAAGLVACLAFVLFKQTISHSFYDGYRAYLVLLAYGAVALQLSVRSVAPPRVAAPLPPVRTVAVRVMCYNEAATIVSVIARLLRVAAESSYTIEIEVIDDGSSDHSGELVSQVFAGDPRVQLTRHAHNLGIGAVLRHAFRPTTNDAVVLLCSDLQFAPEDALPLLAVLTTSDLAIARRLRRQDQRSRRLLTWVDTALSRLLVGRSFEDVHWVRAVRGPWLSSLHFVTRSPMVDLELALAVSDGGGVVESVDLPHYARVHGQARGARLAEIMGSLVDLCRVALARVTMGERR